MQETMDQEMDGMLVNGFPLVMGLINDVFPAQQEISQENLPPWHLKKRLIRSEYRKGEHVGALVLVAVCFVVLAHGVRIGDAHIKTQPLRCVLPARNVVQSLDHHILDRGLRPQLSAVSFGFGVKDQCHVHHSKEGCVDNQ